jgi:hypothetical protein
MMLVSRALGLVRKPISRPIRTGKTRKDAQNGNKQRNHERKMARADWQQNNRTGLGFPN